LRTVAGVVAVLIPVGALVALVNDSLSIFDRLFAHGAAAADHNSTAPRSTETAASDGRPTSPAARDASSTPNTAATSCESRLHVPTDCQLGHSYERLKGPCTTENLVSFMGGNPGVDIVLARVVRTKVSNQCLIEFGKEVEGSAEGVLGSNHDDAWRRCVERTRNAFVGCDQPHSGEYLGANSGGLVTQKACERAAEVYLETSLSTVAEDLQVQSVRDTNSNAFEARCVLSVRGVQLLSGSVRALRNARLPWER
jgi:hypothetical protein